MTYYRTLETFIYPREKHQSHLSTRVFWTGFATVKINGAHPLQLNTISTIYMNRFITHRNKILVIHTMICTITWPVSKVQHLASYYDWTTKQILYKVKSMTKMCVCVRYTSPFIVKYSCKCVFVHLIDNKYTTNITYKWCSTLYDNTQWTEKGMSHFSYIFLYGLASSMIVSPMPVYRNSKCVVYYFFIMCNVCGNK